MRPNRGDQVEYCRREGTITKTYPAIVVVAHEGEAQPCTLSVFTDDAEFPVVVVAEVPRGQPGEESRWFPRALTS